MTCRSLLSVAAHYSIISAQSELHLLTMALARWETVCVRASGVSLFTDHAGQLASLREIANHVHARLATLSRI